MKKLTALFLALALCLSLCTVTAFAETTIETIGDVLKTNPNFPTAKNAAWTNSNENKAYKYNDKIAFCGVSDIMLPLSYEVNAEGSNYKYEDVNRTITFYMRDGVLVSIYYYTTNLEKSDFIGTYTKPVTIADVLATVKDFPKANNPDEIPADAWVNENETEMYVYSDSIGLPTGVSLMTTTILEQDDNNNYKRDEGEHGCWTFNMKNEVLQSITLSGCGESSDGTYTAPATYTVTFDANGHGTAPAAITNVASGTTINKPTDPTAAGYTFGGWYKEAGCTNKWNFDTDTVATDTTLYAKWAKTGGGNHHHGGGSTTPVVSAPKTADMGVAIYGVLTVSSLLGMGWVSKKKR